MLNSQISNEQAAARLYAQIYRFILSLPKGDSSQPAARNGVLNVGAKVYAVEGKLDSTLSQRSAFDRLVDNPVDVAMDHHG